jgi:hypothetical protein
MVNRRTLLTTIGTAGTVAIAGCSSSDGGNNLYEQGNEEDLVPNGVGSDWPDDNFNRNDELNENFLRAFTNPDGTIAVLMDAAIRETVSVAEDGYQQTAATASDNEDYPLGADEAFISDDGQSARLTWRNSNAVGGVRAIRSTAGETQPDRDRASTYAGLMFNNHW